MSTDDVARLERHLTRENESLRALITISREESSKDHAQVRDEIADIKVSVAAIAHRLEAVEDSHNIELGSREVRGFVGRLALNLVTVIVGLGGFWFVASDHLK